MTPIKRRRFFTLCTGAALLPFAAPTRAQTAPHIKWDEKTRVRITPNGGTYGRMVRLANRDILCSFESAGKSWVTRSRDNGKTWDAPQIVRSLPFANAANPEMLVLRGGRILYFFNQRPQNKPGDKKYPFAIGMCVSDNNGASWKQMPNLFEAGTEGGVGCWEPAAVQDAAGKTHLFFANEFPYPKNDDQEITRLISGDEGRTWSKPETVCVRSGHRDGMPVPILFGTQILFAIEDNGLKPGNLLQPALIKIPTEKIETVVGAGSPNRWEAIAPPLDKTVYAGAPYLKQMPSGFTVLSCQSTEGGRKKPRMVVYVGDKTAHNFAHPTLPFDVPDDTVGGYWNALFVKDANAITAISETSINGVSGLWAIDGHLVP